MANSLLFSPIKIGNVVAKNRIVIAPMCQYSCEDGFANDWHLVHLGARAIGGAGIVMMESTAVEDSGRITPGCPGIWKNEHIEQLKRIAHFIKSQGSIPAIQLAHAGRKASTYAPWIDYTKHIPIEEGGWQAIAPSALAFDPEHDPEPKEATLEDIARIKKSFVEAALRAIKSGFEIIELHYAHGYLIHSFLSPYSNKRTDQYGGSFENRIRLALEIINDVKSILPQDYPLFVRISCHDFSPDDDGWDMAQSIELAKRFKQLGVHLVDCSSSGNVNRTIISIYQNNVDQVEMAAEIKQKADIPTGAVGGIVTGQWAEIILQLKKATLIFIARASLDDPNWPMHAALELKDQKHTIPAQYSYSIKAKGIGGWREAVLASKNKQQIDKYLGVIDSGIFPEVD